MQSQLAFQHELARLLIAGYDGYKHPSTSGKCVIQTLSSKENLKGHFLEKLQGRKKACAMCSKDGKNAVEDASSKPGTVANKVALPYVC